MNILFKDILEDVKDIKDKGIVFIKGGQEDLKMSYSTIYNKSLHALAFLQLKGIKPGMEAIFQINNEEDFVIMCWACIMGGIIPVPLSVAANHEQKMQLLRIWDILERPFFLTSQNISDKLLNFFAESAGEEIYKEIHLKTVLFDDFENVSCNDPVIHKSNYEDTILLLFSSGSTGDPKAVIITQRNLISNIQSVNERWNLDEDRDCSISWMPLTHVMGLILQHFTSIIAKINQVIMQTALFVDKPTLWLKKAEEYNATLLSTPNFGMKYVIEAMENNLEDNIDLSSVRMICDVAEPISIDVCNQFLDILERFHLNRNTIVPLFGMTEGTMSLSSAEIGEEIEVLYLDRRKIEVGNKITQLDYRDDNAVHFVALGKSFSCCEFRICDEEHNPLQEDTVGYVQVRGETVTKGYYKNEEATIASISSDGWLTTGDLGFLHDEKLVITGRVKDVIFVNGQNIYSHDIERIAETAEYVNDRRVAACAIKHHDNEKEGIGIFVQYEDDMSDFIEIIKSIKETISEKMGLEVYDVVPITEIPKTRSGKTMRYQLAKMYQSGKFAIVLHEISTILLQDMMYQENKEIKANNKVEERILEIWQSVLKNNAIDVCTSYFRYGVSSLMMLKISEAIKSEFRVNIDIGTLFECKNIRSLSKIIEQEDAILEETLYPSTEADLKNMYEKFPLTEIQTAYLVGRNKGYELGGISTQIYIELKTKLDVLRLNRALQKLISKHGMMRTIFIDNQQQILGDTPTYFIEIEDLSGLGEIEVQARLITERNRMSHHIFAPDQWPLFEFKAIKCDKNTHYLLISLDMLIVDAGSIDIIATELMEFYNNEELKVDKSNFSFRDYVLAYKNLKNSFAYANDKNYWMDKLDDFPDAPNLPTKVDISKIDKPNFKRVQKLISQRKWEKLKNEAMIHDITPSSMLCTMYLEVLSSWSNQPRLSINLTVANRYGFNKDVEKLVGDFTSVIPLEADLGEKDTFWNKAKIVQNTIMEGLEHRHYDGVEFVRELGKLKNYGNKAVIPVVFTSFLSNEIWDKWNCVGDINYIITQTSQVYLDYQASEIDGQLLINWDYVSNLLEDSMVEHMFSQYVDMLLSICNNEEVGSVNIANSDMYKIQQYNNTKEKIEIDLLHKLFEEQVEKRAKNIAIIDCDDTIITYQELNERANRVARKLKELGVKSGDLVGVSAARCKESIVNILGILKAGGAYVPIDPQYPQERIDYIVEQSKCDIILGPEFYTKNELDIYPSNNMDSNVTTDNIAYVIYTSGSTGNPKGVVITHGAAANTIVDINRKYQVDEKDRILGISSMCFDLSVYDIFGALASGATLVQIPDQRDVANIYETIEKYKITIWNSVPAIMDMMIQHMEGSVSYEEVEKVTENTYDNNKVEEKVIHKEKYYWSPAIEWDEECHISDYVYVDSEILTIFPRFYFYMKKGGYIDDIYRCFSEISKDKLEAFIQELINNKVLVSTIINPHDVFKIQEKLFDNKYDEDIIYNPDSYERFKRKQLNREFNGESGERIYLKSDYKFPSYIEDRYSHRKFNENEIIPFSYISQLLSVFMQRKVNNHIQYYYPCAGGLYPIDVFLYVKEDRVENLKQGIYYYSPKENSLLMVNESCTITDDVQYYTNKSIFNSSAVTIYMVYNAEVTMPKYGGSAYLYACIDTGIMINTMTNVAEMLDIGTCSIGRINFDMIKSHFRLNNNQVLIHTVEIGLKENVNINKRTLSENQLLIKDLDLKIPITDKVMENDMEEEVAVAELERNPEKHNNTSLRVVLLSGDWIPLSLPKKIKDNFKNSDIISLGGATEASIWSIYYPIKEENEEWKSVPYGKPLANQQIYVLDYKGNLCQIGVAGELYIGGLGLANGYMNDIEKTNQSFINHPILGKLYKTGDYGMLLKDGTIEFLGRKDQQVKIRGYRVELGEIENCLMNHPDIKSVSVVDHDEKGGKKYLCAYVVSDKKINTSMLREYALKKLPEYMIPAIFVQINEIPLTPNGKVNKKVLPKPDITNMKDRKLLKPRNELEEQILDIWRDILSMDDIGVDENFFDVGGDSMLLLNVHSRIDRMYPKMIKITDLFTSTSISKLSELIHKRNKTNRKKVEIQALELPEDYLAEMGMTIDHSMFMFEIDAVSTKRLKDIADKKNIKIENLFTALYMYTMNQVSGKNKINIQTMIENKDTVYSIKVDFEKLTQFDELFRTIQENNSLDKYMINDLNSIEIRRDKKSIILAFFKKNLCTNNINLLEFYDHILAMEENKNKINFVCEYNKSKIKENMAKRLIYDYVQLIKAFIDKYGNELYGVDEN